jgi:hypothetical protein
MTESLESVKNQEDYKNTNPVIENLKKGSSGCMFAECIAMQIRNKKIKIVEKYICQNIDQMVEQNNIHQILAEIIQT